MPVAVRGTEDRPGPGSAPRRGRRLAGAGLVVAAAALILSGCQISSGVNYVSHRAPDGVDVYFRVPPHWTLFDTDQVIQAENGNGLGPTQLKQISDGQWIESMSPKPGVKASQAQLGDTPRFPTALTFVQELNETERDELNFAAMRSIFFNGTDPLAATSGFQVLNYNEFTDSGGIRGIKMVVNVTNPGSAVETIGQVTAVDANTDYEFVLGVACDASCWGENASAITSLMNSWTVKEQAP